MGIGGVLGILAPPRGALTLAATVVERDLFSSGKLDFNLFTSGMGSVGAAIGAFGGFIFIFLWAE